MGMLCGRMADKASEMGQDVPRVSPHTPGDFLTVLEE